MATVTYYFEGEVEWAKVHTPVEAYDKSKPKEYSINVYIKDWDLYEKSGLRLKTYESKDGKGKYIKFRCPSSALIKGKSVNFKPDVLDFDGNPTTAEVGNGSRATVKVEVYDTRMGKGHRLSAVRVDTLVPYIKEERQYEGEVDSPF